MGLPLSRTFPVGTCRRTETERVDAKHQSMTVDVSILLLDSSRYLIGGFPPMMHESLLAIGSLSVDSRRLEKAV